MISKPKRGMDVLAWCAALYDELQPLFKAKACGGMGLRKGAPAWIFSGQGPASASRAPWQVYASPDAEGAAAWRTVRVHAGTINDQHPRTFGEDSFSDDTAALAADMDIELEAGKTAYLVAVQTRHTSAGEGFNAWDFDKTYIFFTSDDPETTPPFPGWPDVPDLFRNAYYRTIAEVTCGSDDEEAEDFQSLEINQILDANLAPSFTPPAFWEPVIVIADPAAAGENEWCTAKIFLPGFLTPSAEIESIGETFEMEAGAVALFWLRYTLDQATGEATAVELESGTELPVADAPDPGEAPEFVCRLLASLQVPENAGKSVLTMAVASEELAYQIATVGWDVDESGAVVNLYAGDFF